LILLDSSARIALALSPHAHHLVARKWFEAVIDPHSVYFCRPTQLASLRLITTDAVLAPYGLRPLSTQQAWSVYDAFLADDRIDFQAREPEGLEIQWRRYTERKTSSPKLWMDAYLAAFAQAGGYRMVTTDAAFRQFDGLDLVLLGSS
jgi:toxin-antitoxin system PIN domain toxin